MQQPVSRERTNTLDFNRAVASHLPEMLARARSLVRVKADADDLLQETLLRAYKHWSTWQAPEDRPGDPRPWLQTIMVTVYCDWFRKAKKRRRLLESFIGAFSERHPRQQQVSGKMKNTCLPLWAAESNPAKHSVAAGTLHDELMRALDQLDPTWRKALEARIEGESQQDIARQLAIPPGTVMSRVYRARRAIGNAPGVAELARREYGMRASFDDADAVAA